MMNKNIEEILWRYFEDKATNEEIDFISNWLDINQDNRHYFASVKKTFMEVSAEAADHHKIGKQGYARFQERINRYENEKQSAREISSIQFNHIFWKYAAVFVIALGVGALTYYVGSSAVRSNDKSFCEIEVPYGARSLLTLPDGSKIWLNAGSKLKYNRDFDIKSRDVFLEGEAFFDVEKRKHPMVVHTSHLDIRVLGTMFNVKSYPDEENIEATLVEGNIRIESKASDRPLFLKPKEKLTFHKPDKEILISNSDSEGLHEQIKETIASQELSVTQLLKDVDIIEDVNTDESTSWKDGKLIINNEPLEELTKKLERKYDVTFTFDSEKLKTYSYSGTLRDFPLEQVLRALELTSPIRYIIREKTVILFYNKSFKPVNQ